MFVFVEPGSAENQPASGAEAADGLSVEGYPVIQQYKDWLIFLNHAVFISQFNCIRSCIWSINAFCAVWVNSQILQAALR